MLVWSLANNPTTCIDSDKHQDIWETDLYCTYMFGLVAMGDERHRHFPAGTDSASSSGQSLSMLIWALPP